MQCRLLRISNYLIHTQGWENLGHQWFKPGFKPGLIRPALNYLRHVFYKNLGHQEFYGIQTLYLSYTMCLLYT